MLEQIYGKDATEWLLRWDNREWVWSIQMGRLGPWHEQDIQSTAAELLRILLAVGFDPGKWDDDTIWQDDCEVLDHIALQNDTLRTICLVGEPRAKALALAARIFREGPAAMITDAKLKERRILILKESPVPAWTSPELGGCNTFGRACLFFNVE